ncbi:hypothetical protein [Allorhizocola rhizosphaerae]|uniref:hypothetical protein n=1 Tax=Allorhizocola rhizosphaerae TaxID=1872709 RepID=UPI000E3C90F0|nr:hypothetical protein [Allorhizocola rhizosphaerae]
MTSAIMPRQRPAFGPTGREATITLITFADEDVLAAALSNIIPQTAPSPRLTFACANTLPGLHTALDVHLARSAVQR